MKKQETIDEYLMGFFIEVLVKIVNMPDEMIDTLIEGVKRAQGIKAERLERIKEIKSRGE